MSGEGAWENGGNGTGNTKHDWQVQNRQGEVKNSIGNGGAKELACMTHGHELRAGNAGGSRSEYRAERDKEERKNGTTVIA